MKTFLKTALLATIFLMSESAFSAQISIGIQIGQPPPPRVIHVVPARPSRELVWVDGYWYPVNKHYRWQEGYWVRPPFAQAVWIVPRYSEGRYFAGYWSQPVSNGKGHRKHGRGHGHDD
jgi:hypothetical protein